MNILSICSASNYYIPMFASKVTAGFPSPADDYIEERLDLNSYLVPHPNATYFAKLSKDTAIKGGVKKGSILVVDKSIISYINKVVLAVVQGEFILRKVVTYRGHLLLITDDKNDRAIPLDSKSYIWGVVTSIITKLQ